MRNSHARAPRFLIRFAAEPEGGSEEKPAEGEDTGAENEADEEEPGGEDEDDEEESWDHDRALAKIRKANAEAKSQRERAKAAEEKAAGAEDLEKRASAAEAKALRLEVALELGLPKTLASRLQGNTVEELTGDAEELLALFASKTPSDRPKPKLRGGATPDDKDDMDVKTIVDQARRV